MLVLFLCALLAPAVAFARTPATPLVGRAGLSGEVRVGFGGYAVPDAWIPLFLRLSSDRDRVVVVEVTTARVRPAGVERVRLPVHLTPGTALPVTVPTVVRDLHAPITARVFEQDEVLAEWRVAVPPTRLVDGVVLALSRQAAGLQPLLGESSRLRVAYVPEEDLPARWQLYEGVAAVVLRDLDDRRLLPAQVEALAGWIGTGGRLLVVAPPQSDLLRQGALRPLLSGPALPPLFPTAPERSYRWGRGRVTVVPGDPFRADLPPDAGAVWTRLLDEPRPGPFVDRTVLDALPQSPGTSIWIQLLIVLMLGGYLVLLRLLTRGLQRGRAGWVFAAVALAGVTVVAGVLNVAARRGAPAIIQGAVAVALPEAGLALVESSGRIILPRGGAFALEASRDLLVRPLGGAETTLTLAEVVRFEGRAAATFVLRASTLVPLTVRGDYREAAEGMTVEVTSRGPRPLRDPVAFLDGRIQPLPSGADRARLPLSPLGWREPPGVEHARGTEGRLRAWAFGRLRGDAILGETVSLVAWLDDDRGVLHWNGQPAVPLLLVLPLSRAEGAR